MQLLPSLPHLVRGAPPGADAPAARNASAAGAHLEGASNRPRAAEVFAGLATRIGSGVQALGSALRDVFGGIRNLCRGDARQPAATTAAPQSAAGGAALMLEAAESTMVNALPTLAAMLQPDAPPADLGAMRNAYRTMGAGINTFDKLVGMGPPSVREAVGRQAATLANPNTVIAGGETKTQVWNRMERGDRDAVAFLADPAVKRDLLRHVHAVRDMAAGFATSIGQPERAARLDALCRDARRVD